MRLIEAFFLFSSLKSNQVQVKNLVVKERNVKARIDCRIELNHHLAKLGDRFD
jgi:hypothetical protein